MKRILLALLAAMLCATQSFGGCPVTVKCSLDGEYMFHEEDYYNGLHHSARFGHDHYENGGKVHHYIIVSCDD